MKMFNTSDVIKKMFALEALMSQHWTFFISYLLCMPAEHKHLTTTTKKAVL